jgi:hypothetical protein
MEKLITLITFTHNEYSDIWPIVFDTINQKIPNIPKIIALDKLPENKSVIESLYDKIVLYNPQENYPEKILECLKEVSTPYVLFLHDIDIVINFDINKFNKLLNLVTANSIDRCILGMIPRQPILYTDTDNDIVLTDARLPNISSNFYTPYDVGPSIWLKDTFQKVMNLVRDSTYRNIEYSMIQTYLQKYRIVAMTSSDTYKSIYQIGRPFSSYFTFLHILSRGEWFQSSNYMDLENVFNDIIYKYSINREKRGITNVYITPNRIV